MTKELIELMKLADAYAEYKDHSEYVHSRAALQSAIEALQAENERLIREVVNRNQRALDGDKALLVRDAEFLRNEALQAERDALQADYNAKCSELELVHESRDALAAKLATFNPVFPKKSAN